MTFNEKKRKLSYLLEMVLKGRCHSADEVAIKFDCSKRTIERMIDNLNDEGYQIKFCRKENKYKNFADDNF